MPKDAVVVLTSWGRQQPSNWTSDPLSKGELMPGAINPASYLSVAGEFMDLRGEYMLTLSKTNFPDCAITILTTTCKCSPYPSPKKLTEIITEATVVKI